MKKLIVNSQSIIYIILSIFVVFVIISDSIFCTNFEAKYSYLYVISCVIIVLKAMAFFSGNRNIEQFCFYENSIYRLFSDFINKISDIELRIVRKMIVISIVLILMSIFIFYTNVITNYTDIYGTVGMILVAPIVLFILEILIVKDRYSIKI